MQEQLPEARERPIGEAAEEVKALAAKGREMLEQIQRSHLWALLFIPRVHKPNE